MKKFLLTLALCISVLAMLGQNQFTRQIAFGAKAVDSISGAVTKYYYFNVAGTVAGGLVVSTVPITRYKVTSMQAFVTHPLVYTASDSVQLTWEISLDNVNWGKWTNSGATTPATNIYNWKATPQVIGANVAYVYGGDLVTTTSTDAGALWLPKEMFAPYLRLKCVRYKATSASYVNAWVVLTPIK